MKQKLMSKPSKLVALLVGATLLGAVSQSALAVGTAANTTISNTATLSYSVGAVPQTSILSSPDGLTPTGVATTFLVDNKVNLLVTAVGPATSVIPDPLLGVTATQTFTVANSGNGTQDFALAVVDLATGTANPFGGALTDNYDSAPVCTITGATFLPLASGTFSVTGGAHLDALAADAVATVTVQCTTPAAQANNSLEVISLTATARTNDAAATLGAALVDGAGTANDNAAVENVFADAAKAAITGTDAANNAADTANGAFVVQTAVLSVAKVASVICDPFFGSTTPKNIPGSYVQYAITITNSGAAAATLSQITDALQVADVTFDPLLISGAGAAANCAAGVGSLSATGFGAVKGAGLVTTYAAPGLATQNVTAGATFAAGTVTIDFPTLTGTQVGAAAGSSTSLPASSFITVYFNAFVN
jgi:hypothetical protein